MVQNSTFDGEQGGGKPAEHDADTTSFGFSDVPRSEKSRLVRGVFESVADSYDLMNDLMSGGVHRLWKDMTMVKANPQPGERLIDVAGGTGDLARRWLKLGTAAAARRGGARPDAVVCDINLAMLSSGLARSAKDNETDLSWVCGDAQRLPFPNHSADCVTIAFGIRNVTDRAAALSEMRRVLKPGGRFLCLEFSRPTSAALEAAYDAWSFHAIPRLGQMTIGDADSYRYLVESIRRFPNQDLFAAELKDAGFANVSVTNYTRGVAALHTGWRA